MNGGERIARVLHDRGVREIFTLCGGHISPILVEAKRLGIRITDVRDEATAVFAADAYARLTGIPGVAAVTAGPGLTNTITPLKNAQLAQSPVLVLGGATATALKKRGALQDIDQMPLMAPHVKFARAVKRLRDLAPAVVEALETSDTGVPGPVFVECPVDLLYDEEIIRSWYADSMPRGNALADKAVRAYLNWHADRLFGGADRMPPPASESPAVLPRPDAIRDIVRQLATAKRPVMVCGSQALARAADADLVRDAIVKLGIPVYLSGMARGLLGADHELLFRHRRRDAIKGADLVILAGVPCDFRLDYGKQIRRSAKLVSFNLSRRELRLNHRPDHGLLADPGLCLRDLADATTGTPPDRSEWFAELRQRDVAREADITERAAQTGKGVNPLRLCREIDAVLPDDSVLVADGGNAAVWAMFYHKARVPNRILSTFRFGMLGAGMAQAVGAAIACPDVPVCCIIGDGAFGFHPQEVETAVRNKARVIWIVLCDRQWGMVKINQQFMLRPFKTMLFKKLGEHETIKTDLGEIRFDLLAQSMGAHGERVSSAGEFRAALQRALDSGGAAVIHVDVDPVKHMWAPGLIHFKKMHEEPAG